jgi:hypothetical protein
VKTRVQPCCSKETFNEAEARRRLDRIVERGVRRVLPMDVERCRHGGWHLAFPPKPRSLKPRSEKQEAKYRVRRDLVAELLVARPVCERCKSARSTDVHEPGMRSRGADICDPAQCVCLCWPCHRWIHDHPADATAEGWMVPSWEQ